jgi:hypothetical protein
MFTVLSSTSSSELRQVAVPGIPMILVYEFLDTCSILKLPWICKFFHKDCQNLKRKMFLQRRIARTLETKWFKHDRTEWNIFLSLWEIELDGNRILFLSGSLLLWALEIETELGINNKLTPNDTDIVLLQRYDAGMPLWKRFILGLEKENREYTPWLTSTIKELKRGDQYKIFRISSPESNFPPTRMEMEIIVRQFQSSFYDSLQTQNLIWKHVEGYDLDFLRNSWSPNRLILFDIKSLITHSSPHKKWEKSEKTYHNIKKNFGMFSHSTHKAQEKMAYWRGRVTKYFQRGFKILNSKSVNPTEGTKKKIKIQLKRKCKKKCKKEQKKNIKKEKVDV